ncbi:hypothetical protein ACEWH9_14630 [Vibrio diabolicus]|uniref:hypothetical protein n=1 Tax=Vibrio diabolicus TaxID=50719 RepID=UPI0035A88F25
MEFLEIKKWLMETLLGVITLGAFGSILGSILIYVLRRTGKYLYNSRKKILLKLFYPIGRQIEIGRSVNNQYAPNTEDGQFLVYHVDATASSVIDANIFLCFITLTAHVSIAHGIERPILLSALIALTLISAFGALKSSLRVSSHTSKELSGNIRQIKKTFPKSADEWLESRAKKEP